MSNTFNWTTCTVKDVVERHFCGPSPDCEERQIFAPEEWGVLKTTAITWAGWDEKAHKVLPRAFWGQAKIEVHAGDVLVTKAGPRNRVGVVCHIPSTRSQLVVSGKMIGLRPTSETVNASFLAGLLATQEPQKYIHDRTTGMAESQVNFANDVLLSTPLLLPPIQEQNLIARVLDTLGTAIRETEAIVDKLKVVKQGLLQDLLTRGIDANGELRPTQSEAPLLYKDSPLGWIPKEWKVGTVENYLDCIIDYRGKTPEKTDSGVPLITAKNVRLGYIDPEPCEFIAYESFDRWMTRGIPRQGDVLFTTEAPLGNVAQIETAERLAFAQRMIILQAGPRIINTFLKYLMLGQIFRNRLFALGSGSTVEGIQQSTFRRLLITVPESLAEQERIVQQLTEMDSRINNESHYVAKLKQTKSGLMSDLLTGRVRVTRLLEETAT